MLFHVGQPFQLHSPSRNTSVRKFAENGPKVMFIRTDGPTDQRTNIPSYRDAMATSTKFNSDSVGLESVRTTGYRF